MKNKVVVVGSYNTDLNIKTDRFPRPGETIIGSRFSKSGGGKGANQAAAAARAGADVSLVARVGNDVLGREGIERLSQVGINTKYVFADTEIPTGVAFIVVDKNGENSIVVASGANSKLSPVDIETAGDEILSADVILLQLESSINTIESVINKSYEKGITIILNPAPAHPLSESLLQKINTITPNRVEAEMLTGIKVTDEESLRLITKRLFNFGIKNVLITLGAKGVFAGLQDSMEFIPSFKVNTIDSTGAGDVFNGSLAAFLSNGIPMKKAIKLANASAAISVTRIGAQNCAPTRLEIEKFLSYNNPLLVDMVE
jgi:ribokinase